MKNKSTGLWAFRLVLSVISVGLITGYAWATTNNTGSDLDSSGNIQFSIYNPHNATALPGNVKLTPNGDVSAGGNVSATTDVSAGGNVSATTDILAGGNMTAGGNVSATGNITATGNVTAKGNVSATGNLSATGFVTPGSFAVGTACSTQGALGFDKLQNKPVYCNGALWVETAAISCSDGQALSGINANGTPSCSTITLNVSCLDGQVLKGIKNGTPDCVVVQTAPAPALASCRLDQYNQPSYGKSYYSHIQPNGQPVLAYGVNWIAGIYGSIAPISFAQTLTEPTGWQDPSGGTWVGQVGPPDGSTCEYGGMYGDPNWTGSSGLYCFTCVNGTWSQYSVTSPPQAPAAQPSPGS